MKGNSKDEEIDFLTFSAHKAYAPFGSGAIVGKKDYLNEEDPFLSGGGCVAGVFDERLIWTAVPAKFLRCNSYGKGACRFRKYRI